MTPAKKTARKVTKQASGKPAARPARRTLTAAHKKALDEGRTMSATVNRYLSAVNTPKKRGRKVSTATLNSCLADARTRLKSATGVTKVAAAQEVRDLQKQLAQAGAASATDLKSLESAFVKVAKKFSENRGITYGAWRDAGVPANVLQRAGVARSRG